MLKCQIDDAEFATEKELHNHISRKLKVRLVEYYQKYHERRDLATGELIKFKNKDFYFSSLFNERKDMIDYVSKNPALAAKIIEELFSLRKRVRGLSHQMGQAETRTCVLPSPVLMESCKINYAALCDRLGLAKRYDYSARPNLDLMAKKMRIVIDSREQNPLPIFGAESSKLDFGDYCVLGDMYASVYIERKSLNDFVSTMSGGYERFAREVARAKEMDSHIIVLVESSLKKALSFNTLSNMKKIKATPDFIMHRMRELVADNPNLQFLFVKDRDDAVLWLKLIFMNKSLSKSMDWQYLYDKKLVFPV